MTRSKFVLMLGLLTLVSCSGERPMDLGLTEEGKLRRCPKTPNCVITVKHTGARDELIVDPIQTHLPMESAKENLEKIIKTSARAKIIRQDQDYWHVEFTSLILRFVDDVEFYFGEEEEIHFRSASRIGRRDFGVNRKRMEKIRFRFHQNDF